MKSLKSYLSWTLVNLMLSKFFCLLGNWCARKSNRFHVNTFGLKNQKRAYEEMQRNKNRLVEKLSRLKLEKDGPFVSQVEEK